jgi:HEAT repeat protein
METAQLVELFAARDRRDVAYLLDALRDPEHRFMAAKFLGELRAEEAIPELTRLLLAAHDATRSSAAEALGKIGAGTVVPDLVHVARDDESVVTRTFAITALGRSGGKDALGPLCDLLSDENILVRQSAARALGSLGHPDAIGPLRLASKRERWYSRGIHRKAIAKIAEANKAQPSSEEHVRGVRRQRNSRQLG